MLQSTTLYDSAGRARQVTDANGQTTTTNYNALGKVFTSTDPYGGMTIFTYDLTGNLIRTVYPDGTETRTTYDAMGRVEWTTDRYYTGATLTSAPDNSTTSLASRTVYDGAGRVVGTERYKNVLVKIEPSAAGSSILQSDTPDATTLRHDGNRLSVTSTAYNSAGQVAETIDAAGLRTGTVYYPNGQIKYTGPLNATASDNASNLWYDNLPNDPTTLFTSYTTYQYDQGSAGSLYDRVIDAKGHHTDTYKDVLGRAFKTVFDDGSFTQILYGIGNAAVPGHEVAGQTITGYQVTKIDPHGNATDSFYDLSGRLTDVWNPPVPDPAHPGTSARPHWHYAYDAAGHEISQTDPRGTAGTVTNPPSYTTTFAYDDLGRRISRTLPGGESEAWSYDSFGRLKTHTDFKGQLTYEVYDNSAATGGRLLEERRFNSVADYVSNPNAPAEYTHYTYDSLGRQYRVSEYTGSTATRITDYAYDVQGDLIAKGHLTSTDTSQGTIHYEYDPTTGRHTETWTGTDPAGFDPNNPDAYHAQAVSDTLYGYDSQGRLDSVTVAKLNGATPTTVTSSSRTDALGNGVSTTLPNTVYGYDSVGNLHTVSSYTNTATTPTLTDYEYDDLNRLNSETITRGSTQLADYAYTLRDDGLRDHVIETLPNPSNPSVMRTTRINWTYDGEQRLQDETLVVLSVYNATTQTVDTTNPANYEDAYTYDLNGNRLTKTHTEANHSVANDSVTYSYADPNNGGSTADDRLYTESSTLKGTTTYGYDSNGSLTTKNHGSDHFVYVYDLRNRMTEVDHNGTVLETDTYDNAGDRIRQTVGGVTTDYLIDDNNPTGYSQVLEQSTSGPGGTPSLSYVIGQQVIAQADGSGNQQYLMSDGHGSTRFLLDATGVFVTGSRSDFDAFGNAVGFDPTAAKTTLLYTGQQFDAGIQDYYLRARYYDPSDGRFMSFDSFEADPGSPADLHKYLYCNSNPVMMVDLSGHWGMTETLVTATIIGILAVSLIPASFHGRFVHSYGVSHTTTPKNVAIVTGDLGYGDELGLAWGFISINGFESDIRKSGNHLSVVSNPNESQMIQVLNDNDIVLVISHGNNDLFDSNKRPFVGWWLGGTSEDPVDGGSRKPWITANELDGKVHNPNLIVVTPSCNVGLTSRLSDAIGARYFVGLSVKGNEGSVKSSFDYVSGYLNGTSVGALNDQWLSGGNGGRVVNPTNKEYPDGRVP